MLREQCRDDGAADRSERPAGLVHDVERFGFVEQPGDQRLDEVVAGRKSPGDREALLADATWDDRTLELLGYLDSLAERLPVAAQR